MAKPSKKSPIKKSDNAQQNKFQKPSQKPFKQKPQSNPKPQPQPQPQPLQLEDDAPDFPRGGRKALSKEELEEVRAEVDAEFESEQRALKKKRKDRSKNTGPQSNEDDELGSLFGDGITGKLPKYANKITLKNISPGMKLWGVISEVNEKDIIVSLPGGLRGLVHASEALDPLLHDEVKWDGEGFIPSTLYHVGQLVSCVVLKLGDDKKDKGKQKVWLSLRLALLHKGFALDILQEGMVLTAYVKSIEDHGYMLHFGLPSFTGFMPSTTESEAGKHDVKVHIGQLVQGVVKSIDRIRKVVHLSSDPDEVSKCVTKDLKGISMDLLIPGMMVNARVRSTLENGVMLSFLTYFTGTVDLYHLQKTLPTSNWKDEYSQNKKVNARILFIDPSTRAIGLTLNPHLVLNKAPPSLVKTGDIYEHSKVIRVDRGSGLLLEIPSSPVPTPAYVNVSDVADKEVRKLEKAFKEGSQVRVRVLGFRHLEGLATGVLKTSAFEGSVFTHSDVKPGMVVKARVIAVESFGAIVQLASGVKALCPLRHMSEFEITKPRKKFQVGIDMVFRVLGCKSKRITVTHKKTLVKSKLEILSSYADATEGLLTHGWITKIEKHGCFVHFYNGVHGFAPRSELGLDPGSDTSSMYHVEQVVKCRVTSSTPASHRISLSFIVTPTRASEDEMVKLGSVVSGVVERVTPHAIIIDVDVKGYTKGTISAEHLADNHGLAVLMKSALKPGYRFDNLLVLGGAAAQAGPRWIYPSLLGHLTSLAASLIVIDNYLQGYVCNIIDSGCFVRFVGRLTGFAPKNRAIDDRKADLSEVFYIGQSIRSNILDVNSETGRITVSLKQSLCSSTDASFIQEYFLLEEKIAKLQTSGSDGSDLKWVDDFSIGTVIEGKVREKKESGVVISFQKYDDVFGFITHYQLGGATAEIGSTVRAIVLDVAKIDHLVDLSLKPELVGRSREENSNAKKKRKRLANEGLEVHQTVNAVIEIMKENYVVVSIPEKNYTLGYASLTDYNTQGSRPNQFANGQSVVATIMALPNPSNAGRLLLLLKSVSEMTETSSSKRAKKNSNYHVGSLVQAEVTEMKPLELRVKFGSSFHGRIHITEASDDNSLEDPFNNLRIGQTLTARIVSNANNSEHNKKGFRWELSIKPSVLSGFTESMLTHDFSYSTGEYVTGFVYKVDTDWVWLTISRDVRAQLYILDSACEPDELKDFQKRFCVGKAVSGYILSTNKEKKMLRLSVHPLPTGDDRVIDQGSSLINDPNGHSSEKLTYHICEGAVVGGRITKVLPGVGGLLVQVDPHLFGKVHFTELNDLWLPSPLSGYHEGQLVKCKVLGTSRSGLGKEYIDLSLRASSVGLPNRKSLELSSDVCKYSSSDRKEKIEDLQTDMVVQGYVKSVTPKGCFIMLSRKLDAKILLSNLSDGYVKHPDQEFPIGKLVSGKVISLEPLSKRIEVTLRTSSGMKQAKSGSLNFSSLHVGEIINGTIKRIEAYGLFITIDQSNVVGLCHVSELPEDRAGNIESQYKPGERVRAKILKVDEEQHRVSFGMKTSYADDDMGIETASEPGSDDDVEENDQVLDNILPMLPQSISAGVQDLGVHYENGKHPILAEVESRASIPALEVPLDDDTETSPLDDSGGQSPQHVDNKSETASKANQRTKKKEKGEREREIIAAEERLLEKDLPRTADEFEKLVRSSPNSSFVWIKYMGFMLSLSDIEKARSIAERALRTINIREESEKLNIWVAYFNLENQYGDPPEDAVVKLFQRALQYCDPKKVHLALLGVYERTEQHKLADELLDKMLKKFKHSCKVWLRRIQSLLKQNQDGVQSVVNRALICLPKHKHIKFISQTAILEFKGGVPDRGRSMFEGMLREYPKRTDLWSVYLDQEIRLGDVDLIRALFERAISLSLPPKKMKFLFKKYLEFEKSHGDEELIEYVKRKALEYVESSAA